MPAKDTFHHAVRNALIKAGWTITHDPFTHDPLTHDLLTHDPLQPVTDGDAAPSAGAARLHCTTWR